MLSRLFNRWSNRWAIIHSFREVAQAGLPHAAKVISATRELWALEIATDPAWEKVFSDKKRFAEAGGAERMSQELTRIALENARQSVDAASIVFAHSILDDMALDSCKIIAALDRPEVEHRVEKRRVSLEEWRDRGPGAVRDELIAGFLEELRKDSLLAKVDFIFQFCRPPQKWSAMKGYEFDRDRLVRFDKARHDIVHGGTLSVALPNLDIELFYIMQTGLHFILLINHRYGLKMDPSIAVGQSQPPPPNAAAGQSGSSDE